MRIRVTFETELPDVLMTGDEIKEWLEFRLDANSWIRNENPLVRYSVSADRYSVDYEVIDG